MAVPMSVTVTIPMTMPRVVSTERSLLARMALHEIARPSRSSVRKFIRREDEWIGGLVDYWMMDGCAVMYRANRLSRACFPAIQSAAEVCFPPRNATCQTPRSHRLKQVLRFASQSPG